MKRMNRTSDISEPSFFVHFLSYAFIPISGLSHHQNIGSESFVMTKARILISYVDSTFGYSRPTLSRLIEC